MNNIQLNQKVKWLFIWIIIFNIHGCGSYVHTLNKCEYTANTNDVVAVQKAADAGCSKDQFNLAQMYRFGRNGLSLDYKKAAEYYQLAANQNHVYAQNNLGLLYTDGLGVSKDLKIAKNLFETAANQGNADAQNNLATMYIKGEGVAQDYEKAFELFQKAAFQGNGEAALGLFKIYGKGWGVPVDDTKSYAWLKIASETKGSRQEEFKQLIEHANTLLPPAQIQKATALAEELKKEIRVPNQKAAILD